MIHHEPYECTKKNVLDEEGKNNGDVASVWLSHLFILLHENMLFKCFFSCLTYGDTINHV